MANIFEPEYESPEYFEQERELANMAEHRPIKPNSGTITVTKSFMQKILDELKCAKKCALLESVSFDRMAGGGQDDWANDLPKTELEVNDFIRSRVKRHHRSWIIDPIDSVIEMIEHKIK